MASPKCHVCHNFAVPSRARDNIPALYAQNATPTTTSAIASPKCYACHDFVSPKPRARQHPSPLDSYDTLPLPRKYTFRCTEYCAYHDFGNGIFKVLRLPRFREPEPRTRQHPSPLDSCQMLPLPRKHTLRCIECYAYHDFGNSISKVLRLPRFREPQAALGNSISKMLRLSRFREPRAAARQHPSPLDSCQTQMHRMLRLLLRLPRLRQWHLQSATPATIS